MVHSGYELCRLLLNFLLGVVLGVSLLEIFYDMSYFANFDFCRSYYKDAAAAAVLSALLFSFKSVRAQSPLTNQWTRWCLLFCSIPLSLCADSPSRPAGLGFDPAKRIPLLTDDSDSIPCLLPSSSSESESDTEASDESMPALCSDSGTDTATTSTTTGTTTTTATTTAASTITDSDHDVNAVAFVSGAGAPRPSRLPRRKKNPDPDTPNTHKQAMKHPMQQQWREAEQREYDAMIAHDVWDEVPESEPLSAGSTVITSRWVYKIKCAVDHTVGLFKARITALVFFKSSVLIVTKFLPLWYF